MFQRLKAPSGAWTTSLPLRCSRDRSALALSEFPAASQPHLPFRTQVRHATHGAAARANGPKNGPGKRLGAKKTGDEYVIPGNIIFRQRGTNWHAGTNCGRGRDHTIYALEEGYVKYYRDPKLHPKRRFIGVVFDRSDTLPLDPNAPRRRRLNMYAAPRPVEEEGENEVAAGGPSTVPSDRSPSFREGPKDGRQPAESLVLRSGYNYRESNYSIGRTAERAGVKVKLFKPGDRFLAWRKTAVRRRRRAMLQQMKRKKGSARKGKQK